MSGEIIMQEHCEDLSLGNDQIVWIADQAEKRVAAINTIMSTAIKMTTEKDWVKIGGNPYLMETGASKIARMFNISWQISPPAKEYEKDGSGHYMYRASGLFHFAGAEITAEGLRSTRDEFFIGSAGTEQSPKVQKKPQDVDERDVMQAAYTNCLNNGIKRVLPGLRNIDVKVLEGAGMDVSKIKEYDFNSGQQREMSGSAKDQKADIEKMLKAVYGDRWQEGLEKETAFTGRDGNEVPGKSDISKLTEKQILITHKKIKEKYDKWVNENGQPNDSKQADDGN